MVARHAPVNIGDMDTRLVFRRRFEKETPNDAGQTELEYQDIGPVVWASCYPDRDGAREVAGRRQGETGWKITVHWTPDLAGLDSAKDIAVDAANEDRVFRIDEVLPSDRRDWISIRATTGVAV